MQYNGKIYKITNGKEIYIGSTRKQLNERMNQHKASMKRYITRKSKNWCSSFKILTCSDCSIQLIEKIVNKDDLLKREKYHIENNECVNVNKPLHDKVKYGADYRSKFHNSINERLKSHVTCECGAEVTYRNLQVHKRTHKHKNKMNKIK